MSDLASESFDEELSELIHKHAEAGLSASSMVDSLEWHIELASVEGRGRVDDRPPDR